jgi:hypothetical protein
MLIRRILACLALSALVSLAGCKCCNLGNRCDSPAIINARPISPGPCNNCGGTAPPTVVTPPGGPLGPGPGQQPPAYYPPGTGPFGTSTGPKI